MDSPITGGACLKDLYVSQELLVKINKAKDVRDLPREKLPQLCAEVRECLIDTVSKTAGHLASGLGVVELTVALHYVFDTPHDVLVWDVGHQAYPHKILTGHRQELPTIRQKDGLHAFIWRNETEYDLLTTGHASTSIGSALGIAVAQRNLPKNKRRKVVAIIGDGALSGGCAFEALNHAGTFKDVDLTVILNDNEMSISENVGSMAQGLSHVLSSPHYVKLVEGGKRILKSFPAIKDLAKRAQEHMKGMIMPGTLFEEFGFNYIGPIDGHDINRLVSILQNVKEMSGLNFLHVVTTKGKGYKFAEQDPICYHGVPVFDREKGIASSKVKKEDLSFSSAFGRWMCDKAKVDEKLMAVTPAMRIGSGLANFAKLYPQQFFDVAIAEQHAMVFASGLAAGGMRPVVNIYSSFLQRAYDGLIHDMAIQDLPMILCIDRGGLVGPDGPTHNGSFDIAYTRTVPNLLIMAPSSREELYNMLNTAYSYGKPSVIRYPRDNGESLEHKALSLNTTYKIGAVEYLHINSKIRLQAQDAQEEELKKLGLSIEDKELIHALDNMQQEGSKLKVALLVFGPMVHSLKSMSQDRDYSLINMRFIKPLNEDLIINLAQQYDLLVTIEEGAILGGIGEHISALIAKSNLKEVSLLNIGLHDHFIGEGQRGELLEGQGLSALGIAKQIEDKISTLI